MHSLVVALLCLTLFVDSAKACWWLRQHRSRAQACRPVACRSTSPPACNAMPFETLTDERILDQSHPGCVCDMAAIEEVGTSQAIDSTNELTIESTNDLTADSTIDSTAVHKPDEQPARADESVVVHSPTIVGDAAAVPQAAGGSPAATSAIAPAADAATPAAAQPMPLAAAGPTVLPSPTAPQEPIPDLQPAVANPSPVAPASNEQPVPEPAASTAPAAVDDLAGGPEAKPTKPEPQRPNLFDLYGDEGDDAVPPSEAPPADDATEDADAAAGEPEEESADTTPSETEPEMADEDAVDAEADENESDDDTSETAEPSPTIEEPAVEEPAVEEPAPQAEPEQAEVDPAAAAMAVPNEPLRHWANDAGTHHAQGWLVEVRADQVRILKVNGRHTTMLKDALSAADRDYVSAVGARLAAEQEGTNPAPSTTAGL